MSRNSPILDRLEARGAHLLPYGPPGDAVTVAACAGPVELEYASIRSACALLDLPQRGTLEVTGSERIEFLERMITQKLTGLAVGECRRSFWLNRKGRIDADLRVCELGDRMLIDLDVHNAQHAVASLTEFIFAEDVEIRDATDELHRLALHGPTAWALIEALTDQKPSEPADGRAAELTLAGVNALVERVDSAGVPGFELTCVRDDAGALFDALVSTGASPHENPVDRDPAAKSSSIRLRVSGWLGYNSARIEAGTPLYNIDFDQTSLPAETGVLRDRVSFDKGCYLGQEVVARMDALGHPKQTLVGLRIDDVEGEIIGGAPIRTSGDSKDVGTVTSATLSPMLGGAVCGFAMVKWAHAEDGNEVTVESEQGPCRAVLQKSLRFLP